MTIILSEKVVDVKNQNLKKAGDMQYLIIFVILLISSSNSYADEMYTWEDKDGYHMVDDLGKVPVKYRKKYSIETRNDAAGYTKNGAMTDKGWKTQLNLVQSPEKLDRDNCKRKYTETLEYKACLDKLFEWYKIEIKKIPPHILAEINNNP